jgi:hypothetical protein
MMDGMSSSGKMNATADDEDGAYSRRRRRRRLASSSMVFMILSLSLERS